MLYGTQMKITTLQKRIGLIVVLAALVIAGIAVWMDGKTEGHGWGSNFSLRSEVLSPEDAVVPAVVAAAVPAKTLAVNLPVNYGDAVNEYGDNRFQFVACGGTPGRMVVKKGAVVMLDNRDAKARTIAVGSATYAVKAQEYVLAIANEVGDLQITCDGGGAATLSVQP